MKESHSHLFCREFWRKNIQIACDTVLKGQISVCWVVCKKWESFLNSDVTFLLVLHDEKGCCRGTPSQERELPKKYARCAAKIREPRSHSKQTFWFPLLYQTDKKFPTILTPKAVKDQQQKYIKYPETPNHKREKAKKDYAVMCQEKVELSSPVRVQDNVISAKTGTGCFYTTNFKLPSFSQIIQGAFSRNLQKQDIPMSRNLKCLANDNLHRNQS